MRARCLTPAHAPFRTPHLVFTAITVVTCPTSARSRARSDPSSTSLQFSFVSLPRSRYLLHSATSPAISGLRSAPLSIAALLPIAAGPLTSTADESPEMCSSTNPMHGPAYNSLTHTRCADYSTVTLVAAAPRVAEMFIFSRIIGSSRPLPQHDSRLSTRFLSSPTTPVSSLVPTASLDHSGHPFWPYPLQLPSFRSTPCPISAVHPTPARSGPAVVNSVICWFVFHESWPCEAFAIILGSSDAPCRW